MPLERVSPGFKDISMTFQANPLNFDLIGLKNENAIARSVRNIVFTLPGEKFFDPEFGSQISASLLRILMTLLPVLLLMKLQVQLKDMNLGLN